MDKPDWLPSLETVVDTGVVLALAAATFGTSYDTIATFIGEYGRHGAVQYVGAACPDVLCFIGVREYLRDKRTGRPLKGWISYPVLVCGIGLFETVTLNYMGNTDRALSGGARDFWNSALALLVSVTLILVLMLMHRRDSGPKISKQSDTRQATPADWRVPEPVSAQRVSADLILSHPVSPWPVSPWPVSPWPVSPEPVSPDPVSPDRVSEPPVSPGPVSEPPVSPNPEPVWLEVLPGDGESDPDTPPWEESAVPGEARKGWTLDELTDYVRKNWPISQNNLRANLKTHPRGGAGQSNVVKAIRAVRAEKEPGHARRAVND